MQISFILINITDILPCLKKKLQVDNFSSSSATQISELSPDEISIFQDFGQLWKNDQKSASERTRKARRSKQVWKNDGKYFFFLPFQFQKKCVLRHLSF